MLLHVAYCTYTHTFAAHVCARTLSFSGLGPSLVCVLVHVCMLVSNVVLHIRFTATVCRESMHRSHFWTQAVVRVERATQERKLSGTHTCTAAYTAAHSTLTLPWHHWRPN